MQCFIFSSLPLAVLVIIAIAQGSQLESDVFFIHVPTCYLFPSLSLSSTFFLHASCSMILPLRPIINSFSYYCSSLPAF